MTDAERGFDAMISCYRILSRMFKAIEGQISEGGIFVVGKMEDTHAFEEMKFVLAGLVGWLVGVVPMLMFTFIPLVRISM